MDAAGNSLDQVLLQGFQKDLQVTENPIWTLFAQAIHVYRHHALLSVVEQLAARLINLLSSVKLVSQP